MDALMPAACPPAATQSKLAPQGWGVLGGTRPGGGFAKQLMAQAHVARAAEQEAKRKEQLMSAKDRRALTMKAMLKEDALKGVDPEEVRLTGPHMPLA